MSMINAYREVGSYRGAAVVCDCDPKTVKRAVERAEAGGEVSRRSERVRNYDLVVDVVVSRVAKTAGRISAKRLLLEARAAGYTGSARNFRRLVAEAKSDWRRVNHRGRRPAVWSPGETLVIDWGSEGPLHVFCAVLAWSRWRFVRFAADEKAETTLAMLAECFELLGGVPKMVLAERMGCLKGGVVANVVVPAPAYVRFATHYRFRPDFCNGADPESKGIVENLVGYAKSDLIVPAEIGVEDLAEANRAARAWCVEVKCPHPFGDLRCAGRTAGHRSRPVGPVAVAAASYRPGDRAQSRSAELCADRLRPLLGPGPADRTDSGGARPRGTGEDPRR
jgi:transposase